MKTDNKDIDEGKVAALRSAGWRTDRIATEIGITPETVEEILCNHTPELSREQEHKVENESKSGKIVCLSTTELYEIYEKAAAIGAREAIKTFEQERKKEYSRRDILESMMSIYNDEVIIQSIKNSATRTAIMVSHIETMFGLYYSYCDRSTTREIDLRRYNVVWDMYMAENTLTAREIANKLNVSKESVYSDLRVGIERLTALIFGVDGLNVC